MTQKNQNTPENSDVFGWEDQVEEGSNFPLLPEGRGSFEVLSMKRARKDIGSLGTCNVAELKLNVTMHDGVSSGPLDVNLALHRKIQFKLYQFFSAIGQRKHGDDGPFVPDWSNVVGSTGDLEIEHTPGSRNPEKIFANVKRFLHPDEDKKPDDLAF